MAIPTLSFIYHSFFKNKCMYLHMYALPMRLEDGIRYPRTGVVSHRGVLRIEPGLLEEQSEL